MKEGMTRQGEPLDGGRLLWRVLAYWGRRTRYANRRSASSCVCGRCPAAHTAVGS